MRKSNFLQWFLCCLQPSNPHLAENGHSKSKDVSFNTDHYTEQMKEAFFAKLMLHKGLCQCQEVYSEPILPGNFNLLNNLSKYPRKNQLFLLKYGANACIMATLSVLSFSTKNLKKNPKAFQSILSRVSEKNKEEEEDEGFEDAAGFLAKNSESKRKSRKNKQEFSKLVKGLPEEMLEHLVQRLEKGEVVMDLLNGVHSLSLQLANKGVMVISVEKSQKHLTVFKHSAGLWDFTEQIMALQGDFLEMRLNHMRVDAVIVNFKAETIDLMKEKFCLFKHVKPNIRETLKKAAGISRKIMLILPKHVEVDEIALLFKDFAEFCKEKNQPTLGNSLEIECLSVNNRLEKIVVYYGDICQITEKQEFNYLLQLLTEDQQYSPYSEYSLFQISRVLQKLAQRFTNYQLAALFPAFDAQNAHATHFQAFLQQLKARFALGNEEMLELLQSSDESATFPREIPEKKRDDDQKISEKDSEDASFQSWDFSSTPAFNELTGLKEIKRKITVEECKSAELLPKKPENPEVFSFE